MRDDGQWTYFCGTQPVFHHPEIDRSSFRMFTAQLIYQGACRQVDIVRVFGVSKNSVIRSVDKYRAGGVKAFYAARAARSALVMTAEVTAQAQQLLGAGWSRTEVAEQLGLNPSNWVETVRGFGRLFKQAAGRSSLLVDAAARCSRRWFQGKEAARMAFL